MSNSNLKVGDKVWWEDDDYLLSGKVQCTERYGKVAILTDCGKVTTSVWEGALHKGKCPYLKNC